MFIFRIYIEFEYIAKIFITNPLVIFHKFVIF
jgi:hypothetical protein